MTTSCWASVLSMIGGRAAGDRDTNKGEEKTSASLHRRLLADRAPAASDSEAAAKNPTVKVRALERALAEAGSSREAAEAKRREAEARAEAAEAELRAAAARHDAQVEELRRALAEAGSSREAAEAERREAEARAEAVEAELRAATARHDAQVQELRRALDDRDARIRELEDQIQDLSNATSRKWRFF